MVQTRKRNGGADNEASASTPLKKSIKIAESELAMTPTTRASRLKLAVEKDLPSTPSRQSRTRRLSTSRKDGVEAVGNVDHSHLPKLTKISKDKDAGRPNTETPTKQRVKRNIDDVSDDKTPSKNSRTSLLAADESVNQTPTRRSKRISECFATEENVAETPTRRSTRKSIGGESLNQQREDTPFKRTTRRISLSLIDEKVDKSGQATPVKSAIQKVYDTEKCETRGTPTRQSTRRTSLSSVAETEVEAEGTPQRRTTRRTSISSVAEAETEGTPVKRSTRRTSLSSVAESEVEGPSTPKRRSTRRTSLSSVAENEVETGGTPVKRSTRRSSILEVVPEVVAAPARRSSSTRRNSLLCENDGKITSTTTSEVDEESCSNVSEESHSTVDSSCKELKLLPAINEDDGISDTKNELPCSSDQLDSSSSQNSEGGKKLNNERAESPVLVCKKTPENAKRIDKKKAESPVCKKTPQNTTGTVQSVTGTSTPEADLQLKLDSDISDTDEADTSTSKLESGEKHKKSASEKTPKKLVSGNVGKTPEKSESKKTPKKSESAEAVKKSESGKTPEESKKTSKKSECESKKTPKKSESEKISEKSESGKTPEESKKTPKKSESKKTPKKSESEEAIQRLESKKTPKKSESEKTPKKLEAEKTPKKLESDKTPKKSEGKKTPMKSESLAGDINLEDSSSGDNTVTKEKTPKKSESSQAPEVDSSVSKSKVSVITPKESESEEAIQRLESKKTPKISESEKTPKKLESEKIPKTLESDKTPNISEAKKTPKKSESSQALEVDSSVSKSKVSVITPKSKGDHVKHTNNTPENKENRPIIAEDQIVSTTADLGKSPSIIGEENKSVEVCVTPSSDELSTSTTDSESKSPICNPENNNNNPKATLGKEKSEEGKADIPVKYKKVETLKDITRGLPVSGRFWKKEKKRFRTVFKDATGSRSWAKKMQIKKQRVDVLAKSSAIQADKQRKREELKERQRLNKIRREENERKSEIVQVIKDSRKVKKMKKKQLRYIQTRDTTNMQPSK